MKLPTTPPLFNTASPVSHQLKAHIVEGSCHRYPSFSEQIWAQTPDMERRWTGNLCCIFRLRISSLCKQYCRFTDKYISFCKIRLRHSFKPLQSHLLVDLNGLIVCTSTCCLVCLWLWTSEGQPFASPPNCWNSRKSKAQTSEDS